MRVSSITCTAVAMPPLGFEVTLGGAPCEVEFVIRCGTRLVLLTLVKERKDACRAFGGATASSWKEKNFTSKPYNRLRYETRDRKRAPKSRASEIIMQHQHREQRPNSIQLAT